MFRTFITRFSLSDMASGANSIEALEQLIMAGVSVYEKEDLHAKIYIIDDKLAFIGSANFTHGGLAKNYEILVSIDKNVEPEQYKRICEYIAPWIEEKYQVLQTHIAKYKPEVKEKKQQVAHTSPQNKEQSPFTHAKREEQREWKSTPTNVQQESTVWLKYVGASSLMDIRRKESKERYKVSHSQMANMYYLAFPEKQPPVGIAKGDIVYVAFLGADKVSGERRTFVVGKGISKGFDRNQLKREQIAKERDPEKQKQWPIYLELDEVSVFPGTIQDAMDITKLWDKEGRRNSYAFRGSHMRILKPEAKEFLREYSKQFVTQ